MNMKKYINTISAALLILCFASSCVDLNMNPPSEASSENWYKNADQITMSLNDLYRKAFYGMESEYWTDRRTDDWAQRDYTYELVNGSATSATSTFETYWDNTYKAISRAIRVIESIERLGDGPQGRGIFLQSLHVRSSGHLLGRCSVLHKFNHCRRSLRHGPNRQGNHKEAGNGGLRRRHRRSS